MELGEITSEAFGTKPIEWTTLGGGGGFSVCAFVPSYAQLVLAYAQATEASAKTSFQSVGAPYGLATWIMAIVTRIDAERALSWSGNLPFNAWVVEAQALEAEGDAGLTESFANKGVQNGGGSWESTAASLAADTASLADSAALLAHACAQTL